MVGAMKLIETAIDDKGESYICAQSEPKGKEFTGHILTDLFFANNIPPDILVSSAEHAAENFNLAPGEIRFLRSDVYPSKRVYDTISDKENKPPFKKLFYHSTTTLDFVVVLRGKLILIVGDQEIPIEAGDCIIQRGAAHAWHNYTDEVATLIAVMIGIAPPAQFKLIP